MDAVFRITPPPLFLMRGTAARDHRTAAITWRSQKYCHLSSGASMMVSFVPVPALLMRMSTPSNMELIRAIAASMSFGRETSADSPRDRTRCARAISAASFSTRSLLRAMMATSTPSPASAWATAKPIPILPPVIMARFPFSSRSISAPLGPEFLRDILPFAGGSCQL